MIDYRGIVEEMVKNSSIKSATTIEHNGKWYGIEIILHPLSEENEKMQS